MSVLVPWCLNVLRVPQVRAELADLDEILVFRLRRVEFVREWIALEVLSTEYVDSVCRAGRLNVCALHRRPARRRVSRPAHARRGAAPRGGDAALRLAERRRDDVGDD
ncbi:hypothetical protein BC834DRAFT_78910 [Gloeopeniophorella convolvens]|nr:hypothetical protein BC834DRAFT_78910 [Gloeopeniophorella convolvens]